ncbi:MAG: UDP-galactopyranose mutase [Prevotellaceae bacterium]|nr:UDP-galactopyranose mutase [Candidatus Colivivens caballi]
MKKYDFVIVGAGLYGATFAYLANRAGKHCLVVEARDHVGGNLYCENIEGINVHKYGAHIFHTSNRQVWNLVNSIVEFNRYTNCPVANYHGRLFNLPFNMNTFYQLWGVTTPDEAQTKIGSQRLALGPEGARNLEEQALSLVGRDIYDTLIKEYTEKQWGRKCCELPAFIIRRLPLRFVFDNNYFQDIYQGIPVGGYNRLIEGLLDGVDVMTGVDFLDENHSLQNQHPTRSNWRMWADRLVFTGKIDAFYDYCHGKLEYRTVKFETEVLDTSNYQGNAVVNYTDSTKPYTRIIEHKHFETFGDDVYSNPKTVISKEYSMEWKDGMEAFYPVNDNRNHNILQKYQQMASMETDITFGGRLAEYKYYDMAPVIEQVIDKCKELLP